MVIKSLLRLHHGLTAVLPLAGSRQLADGPTIEELALEADWARELEPVLRDLYYYPIRNGVETAPDIDREQLQAWALDVYDDEFAVAALLLLLSRYMQAGVSVGGQLALNEMGLNEVFELEDAGVISTIGALAQGLVSISSEISLTHTTANELAMIISRLRDEGLSGGEMLLRLDEYIVSRSAVRSGLIAQTESVRSTRFGLVETYTRNGIEVVIFRNAPELTESGPCLICEPLDGNRYNIVENIVVGPQPPLHTGCVCYYEPDMIDWSPPEEIWTG